MPVTCLRASLLSRVSRFILASITMLTGLAMAAPVASAELGFTPGSVMAKLHEPTSQAPPPVLLPGQAFLFGNALNDWIQPIRDAPIMTQAGSRPDFTTRFRLDDPGEMMRDLVVDTPPGLVGNPRAVPSCDLVDFYRSYFNDCVAENQVGVAAVEVSPVGTGIPPLLVPVYNLTPPGAEPGLMGFSFMGNTIVLHPSVRSDGDYGLRVAITDNTHLVELWEATVTLWGTPHDPVHDVHRIDRATNQFGAQIATKPEPFLTAPTVCGSEPLETVMRARSWVDQAGWFEERIPMAPFTGCEKLTMNAPGAGASLTASPTSTKAGGPTGLEVDLSMPYEEDPDLLANPTLRNTRVSLPEGMVINPAAAQGLGACSQAEIGLNSLAPAACPESSKLGTVEITTPLLEHPMKGSVYQAAQNANPFGSTFALYLAAQGSGVQIKLAGRIAPDPVTGQLTTTFDNNPQLPFTKLELTLHGGPRAPLANPRTCGTKTVLSELTGWNGESITSKTTFEVSGDGHGSPCPAAQFAPSVDAGVASPTAGATSPFTLRVLRSDADSELRTVSTALPQGLLAKIAGVPLCSSSQAQAGTCTDASRIGRVIAGAGAGPNPLFIQDGEVFLTQGYKGAPFGLAISVPAVAGPFNLGVVHVRAALRIDPNTAQASVEADPMPRILEGVPLQVRDLRVVIDRSGFMRNPTSCDPSSIRTTLGSYAGETHTAESRFQVADCAALGFNPRLGLRLTGRKQVRSGRHPGVRAVVRQGPGQAGIDRARVTLPRALALDPDNARALCEYTDGIKPDLENHCPAGSIVGRARAVTPLLDKPLVGNVYFVKNVRRDPRTGNEIRTLPMIVAALRGEIAINLRGTSSTTRKGSLVNTFAGVPDAPINRFNLNLRGGRSGILVVTETRNGKVNLCRGRHKAATAWRAQSAKRVRYKIAVKTPCSKKQRRRARAQG